MVLKSLNNSTNFFQEKHNIIREKIMVEALNTIAVGDHTVKRFTIDIKNINKFKYSFNK